jgi:methyltransferase-like protein
VSDKPDIHSSAKEQFRVPNGATLTTGHPITKAAMMVLGEHWPQVVPFERLREESVARLDPDSTVRDPGALARAHQVLAAEMLQCSTANLVELHCFIPRCVAELSECPSASRLARLQAESGMRVVNQRHETIVLDDFSRHTVGCLDGTRDRRAVIEMLAGLVANGTLVAREGGVPITETGRLKAVLAEALDRTLSNLARSAVLVA